MYLCIVSGAHQYESATTQGHPLEIALLIFAITVTWLWFDSISARDVAVTSGREAAERCGLQFLDETVSISKLWLGRNRKGHIQLLRTYGFEVSTSGSDRHPCQITLLGKQVQSWHIPPYVQPTY